MTLCQDHLLPDRRAARLPRPDRRDRGADSHDRQQGARHRQADRLLASTLYIPYSKRASQHTESKLGNSFLIIHKHIYLMYFEINKVMRTYLDA